MNLSRHKNKPISAAIMRTIITTKNEFFFVYEKKFFLLPYQNHLTRLIQSKVACDVVSYFYVVRNTFHGSGQVDSYFANDIPASDKLVDSMVGLLLSPHF